MSSTFLYWRGGSAEPVGYEGKTRLELQVKSLRLATIVLAASILLFLRAAWVLSAAEPQAKENDRALKDLPLPGEVFQVKGHTAFIISPAKPDTSGNAPWVWYAPTLPGLPAVEEKWMFQKFLEAGITVAGIDVGESYGSPKGCALFTSFFKELSGKRGFSGKPCLLARSRGGLMLYNWAVEHPSSVACVAGIYPVCNLESYPGIDKACVAYDQTPQQLKDHLARFNPISRIAPLAKAGVPIFHIHGDSDTVVPLDKNSALLEEQYRRVGGEMTLLVVKGQGHNMWSGWFQCQELVDFVIAHAKAKLQ